nr:MAG TPA: hypothetical protein [Inoviridae sp.]
MTEDLVSVGKWSDPRFIRSMRLNKMIYFCSGFSTTSKTFN